MATFRIYSGLRPASRKIHAFGTNVTWVVIFATDAITGFLPGKSAIFDEMPPYAAGLSAGASKTVAVLRHGHPFPHWDSENATGTSPIASTAWPSCSAGRKRQRLSTCSLAAWSSTR